VEYVKEYVKPTFEFVELRPEERLAGSKNNCGAQAVGTDTCLDPNQYPGQNN
jgi:hypothetical protein